MSPNLHVAWANLLFEGFVAAGVQDVVLSPGSRSTPLALAAGSNPKLRVHVVLDERQGGFFALGQARRTGRPSVVVCTSGTAAAHYLPALLEAREAGVPIIVLTADRPWEAHHVHSSQTTDQLKLFGDAVRGFFAMGTPEAEALGAVARTAQHAVALSRGPRPGGVHVNAPFRKPLEPAPGSPVPDVTATRTQVLGSEARLTADGRRALVELVRHARRTLFVAGPAIGSMASARNSMHFALEVTGGALLAETPSGLRSGASLRHADALVPLLEGALAPDLVITLGLPVVSTALQNWLARSAVPRLVVAPAGWPDPWSTAAMLMPLDAERALEELVQAWHAESDAAWRTALHAADAKLDATLANVFEHGLLAPPVLNEPAIARAVTRALPAESTLLVGNSLPVRDLDVFGGRSPHPFVCLHQRGVAGIDGLLAGAAGVASVADGPVVLYAGDVSFLHDAGALALLSRVRTPLVIVAVNNDGGRIFHELPVARNLDLAAPLRDLFVTPHGHSLRDVATGFGVTAHRVDSLATLEHTLADALRAPRCTVIEAVVPPDAGTDLRRAWRELAKAALS